MRVALVIVTYNRAPVVAATLQALEGQKRAPDGVFVVDNASEDDTCEVLARDFPRVRVVRAGENLGVNAGLALGMREAMAEGYDAFWLMDDDSQPPPDALEELVRVSEAVPGLGIVGYQGGLLRWGRIRHLKRPEVVRRRPSLAPGVHEVDFVIVDGALVQRRAVEAVGYPPEDYFMMIGDIEYPYRMRRAGLRVGVFESDRMHRATLGGKGDAGGKPAWRAYYKARNQVRMAVEYRSPLLLLGALGRVLWLTAAHLRHGERARAAALWRGLWDGLRGRMGRSVEPSGP